MAFVALWHSGYLFSPRYYDEVLELRDRNGIPPDDRPDLADPTNHGAFGFGLYERGRTRASVIVEAPLVRRGSDPWFPSLHRGEVDLVAEPPEPGALFGLGASRVVRNRDGAYEISVSERSRWSRATVQGRLKVRPLTPGSDVIPLGNDGPGGIRHAWQILASRTEVTGRITWSGLTGRRERSIELNGLGYLERNAGRLPLSPAVGRWLWGRFQGSEKTIAYHRIDPVGLPLTTDPPRGDGAVDPAGHFVYHGGRDGGRRVEGARIDPTHIRRNRWGMPHPLEIRGSGGPVAWHARLVRVLDRGPFFVRCLSRLSCEDPALDGVPGITECFLPARWDVPLYRLITQGKIRRGP
ncbi:MAG: hypothetical protein GF346_08895 [Candidatus Eisenbacteria bacterium]|nr:hypothetical protein [Candidatus Latescibacterota bacterium]MBD3302550.1 hypothetical protein [Candidatus Eisenbacteria bacterium]